MRETNVYILNGSPWVKSLCKVLEIAVYKKAKVHLYCEDQKMVDEFDDMLWTYEQLSFLPHAKDNDLNHHEHPIIISANEKILNSADVLVVASKILPNNVSDYKKVIIMVDAKDIPLLDIAAKQIELLKNNEFNIRYFKQNMGGGWEAATSLKN